MATTQENSKPLALVTGATSGIGWATCMALAKAGYLLVACGRRTDRLQELKSLVEEMGSQVHTLSFNVAHEEEVQQAIENLPPTFSKIDLLVNNAGNAHGLGPIHEGNPQDWDAMVGSNISGLLYTTRYVSPGMVQRQKGHIINIGSVAGRAAYAGGAVYCATKTAVAMLTDGMRIDLNPYGIKVTNIEPGLVETEFSLVRFKNDAERAKTVYQGLTPLTADDVADAIVYAATRPHHVVVADMLLMPLAQASATVLKREA